MPRAQKAKQYRKLMREYGFFGFREPYQVLVTSDIVKETMKLDLQAYLERTVQGRVKPMICQCSMRALYANNRDPVVAAAIERAKTFERRRCGHLMDQDALPEYDCLSSVVDPKGGSVNKFNYIVASQDEDLRRKMRSIVAVPLVYSKRSVFVMEPMSDAAAKARRSDERQKLKSGIRSRAQKRKRDDEGSDSDEGDDDDKSDDANSADGDREGREGGDAAEPAPKKIKRKYGPKGPNPLAVKKKKTKDAAADQDRRPKAAAEPAAEEASMPKAKRKRRKKNHSAPAGESTQVEGKITEGLETES